MLPLHHTRLHPRVWFPTGIADMRALSKRLSLWMMKWFDGVCCGGVVGCFPHSGKRGLTCRTPRTCRTAGRRWALFILEYLLYPGSKFVMLRMHCCFQG
jgi:hypothetical protein